MTAGDVIRRYLPYAFFVSGAAWVALIATGASLLLLWPVLTCVLSGFFLLWKPGLGFTSTLAEATALYGLLLAGYQLLVALPLLEGVLVTIAAYSVVAFLVLIVYNVLLLYGSFPTDTSSES